MNKRVYIVSQSGYSKKYGLSGGPVWVCEKEEDAIRNYNMVIDTVSTVDKDNGGTGKVIQTEVPLVGFGKDCHLKFSSGEQVLVSFRACWVN